MWHTNLYLCALAWGSGFAFFLFKYNLRFYEFVYIWPGSDTWYQSDEVVGASVLPPLPSPARAADPLIRSSMPCRSRAEASLSSLCMYGGL